MYSQLHYTLLNKTNTWFEWKTQTRFHCYLCKNPSAILQLKGKWVVGWTKEQQKKTFTKVYFIMHFYIVVPCIRTRQLKILSFLHWKFTASKGCWERQVHKILTWMGQNTLKSVTRIALYEECKSFWTQNDAFHTNEFFNEFFCNLLWKMLRVVLIDFFF